MKKYFLTVAVLCSMVVVGCSIFHDKTSDLEREGQRLFASCDHLGVDDVATIRAGEFVCKGARINPFHGSKPSANNRSCGDCHQPGINFSLTPTRVAKLAADHPVFFDGLDEDLDRLKADALVHVLAPGVDEFRQSPKLIHLRDLCDAYGNCDGLGLGGDRVENLNAFIIQAIGNHMSATTARVAGVDFRVPNAQELKAINAYMRSRLVADQDER
ncbi:MAG: hypothetical protein IIA11_02720 [Proteobacteria bacterium]|nr:hypothetical protein [Pseudomonadota bacterium]